MINSKLPFPWFSAVNFEAKLEKSDLSLEEKELVKHFAEKVSIKVLNQEDLLSKSQAQALIEDFFLKHKVKSYQTSHTSIVNGDQQFITGSLETQNGKFRISILVRGSVISQFRIEHDNG